MSNDIVFPPLPMSTSIIRDAAHKDKYKIITTCDVIWKIIDTETNHILHEQHAGICIKS
jgi:hypothetical protein